MLRYALRGRWLVLLAVVVVAAAVCVRLGIWQLDRLEERRSFNERVESRGELPPLRLDELVGVRPGDTGETEDTRDTGETEDTRDTGETQDTRDTGQTEDTRDTAGGLGEVDALEHRRVVLTGRYDGREQILVRARAFRGSPGQHVVTPLVLGDGEAVLVNRGFVPITELDAPVPPEARPPEGPVRVEGVLRASDDGAHFDPAPPHAASAGTLGHVNRIDVAAIESELPYDLLPVYVRVEAQRPEARGVPIPLLPPEPGEGPHLSYAVQWFTFAAVFLGGWPILVRWSFRRHGGTGTGSGDPDGDGDDGGSGGNGGGGGHGGDGDRPCSEPSGAATPSRPSTTTLHTQELER